MNQAIATSAATGARQRIKSMMDQGVTIQKLVVESGVGRRRLQAWLDGQAAANDVDGTMAAWLEELDQSDAIVSDIDWVNTPTSARITQALDFARSEPSMALVYG